MSEVPEALIQKWRSESNSRSGKSYPISISDIGLQTIAQKAAQWGASQPPEDPSQISDGYHTFSELYEHRHALFLSLMKSQPHLSWISQRHEDGSLPFGSEDWFIAGMNLGKSGPITYHLPFKHWNAAVQTGAKVLPVGRPWDGHTSQDVISRLLAWVMEPEEDFPVGDYGND